MSDTDAVTSVLGFNIDPSKWVEPSETFPGIVEVSAYRWCADEYLDKVIERIVINNRRASGAPYTAEELRGGLARLSAQGVAKIPQWDLRVKRMDATLQLPDGAQAPAIRYGGFDLVKFSQRDEGFVPINPNYGKEAFISGSWKTIAGQIEPPESLEGKMFEFQFWAKKKFGGTIPASNVLAPIKLLPPTYAYTGEVRIFVVREKEEDKGTGTGEITAAPSNVTSVLSDDAAMEKLVTEILPGLSAKSASTLLSAIPVEVRTPVILNGIATGELVKTLEASGKITIAPDGTIALA